MRRERSRHRTPRSVVAVVVVALLWAFTSELRAQDQADTASILRRLETLERLQLSLLAQLNELQQQLAELKRAPVAQRPSGPPQPELPRDPIALDSIALKGDPNARVVIVEYSDFQCPYCGSFARQTLPALEKAYVASGKVRLGFWNLPLADLHPHALDAAEAGECARRQGKFWEMHDLLFADQTHLDGPSLVDRVKTLRLDPAAFGTCVQNAGGAKVRSDLADAKRLGIAVTPTFVIGTVEADGRLHPRQILVGAKDLAAFAAVLDPLLR